MKESIFIKNLATIIVSRSANRVCHEVIRSVELLLILKTEVVWCFVSAHPRGAYEWCMNIDLIIAI